VGSPGGSATEAEHLRHFIRERFHSEPEAASFIGGPAGLDAVLSYDEFARALRLSGYGRAAEPLFARFGRASDGPGSEGVRVRDLLRDCGLPREPLTGSGVYVVLSPGQSSPPAPAGLDPQAQRELRDLREEVESLRHRIREGASQSTGDVRQLNLRVEELLQREAGALRADGLDLRASLTEALRLLDEERRERRERQGHIAESQRCMRELQSWAEERLQRVEHLAKEGRQSSVDIRAAVQEALQLGEMSEFRALGAVAEESRNRETTLARDQQSREAVTQELENRWRRLLGDERLARASETEELARQIGRVEDMLRAERETNAQRVSDMHGRVDEALREVHEESNIRQAEFMQLSGHREQLHSVIGDARVAARDDSEAMVRRLDALERSLPTMSEHLDHELRVLKEGLMDIRQTQQADGATREDKLLLLQRQIDTEVRTREEAIAKIALVQDTSDSQLEQHLKATIYEDRAVRDTASDELQQKVAAVHQELNFEKARAAAQGRELAQAVSQTRDAMNSETVARRQEIANIAKGTDDASLALREGDGRRERMETRLIDQVASLEAGLREEALAREEGERYASDDRKSTRSALQREISLREDLASRVEQALQEERRQREEAHQQVISRHDENLPSKLAKLETLLKHEEETREKAFAKLDSRLSRGDVVFENERKEREEREHVVSTRLAETASEVINARDRARECLSRFEEVGLLKESLARDRLERQSGEAGLELGVKEQAVRMDQLLQSWEMRERTMDRVLGELSDKVEHEIKNRAEGDADVMKQIHARREETLANLAAERRKVEEVVGKADEAFQCLAADERSQRVQAIADLDKRCTQLRDTMDEALKWRIEQYNELVLELSKVSETLTDESRSRQRENTVLENNWTRLRSEMGEEAEIRKASIGELREDIADAVKRLERGREVLVEHERERGGVVEQLKLGVSAETMRLTAALEELRQQLSREVLARDELLAGARHSLKSGLARAGEEWRAAYRTEGAAREEAQLRIDRQMVEVRGHMQELKLMSEHRDEDVAQRLKAAAEALSVEDQARRDLEAYAQRSLDDLRRTVAGEAAERQDLAVQVSGRLETLEEMVQDENACREDLERRVSKELLDARAALNEERCIREGIESRLDQQVSGGPLLQQEALHRESKARDEAIAAAQSNMHRALQAETVAREEGRRDSVSKLQQLRSDLHLEVEERSKLARELTGGLAKVQRLQSEEEETRAQESERLSAVVEGLSESVRGLVSAKDDVVQGYMESVDQVRTSLHKQIVSWSAKEEMLETSLRDLKTALREEGQVREREVRGVADAIAGEHTAREAGLARERRAAEDELAKVQQLQRKAREDEERRLQEKLLEVMSAVSEERDQRQEALRQERQRNTDVHEQVLREQKSGQRELAKVAQAVQKSLEDEGRRGKELDSQMSTMTAKVEESRAGLATEAQQRDAEVRVLEQRAIESEAMLRAEIKERRDMCLELKKGLEAEAAVREDAVATEKRAREAADGHVEDHQKSMLREERGSREAAMSQVSQDLLTLKTQIMEEIGRFEDERGNQNANIHKLRTDVAEILGERRVDSSTQRDGLEQLRAEVLAVTGTRKEDAERAETALVGMASRFEQCTRACRDQTSTVEQLLQSIQSDIQREGDDRSAALRKLEARMNEERRSVDTALTSEARAREDVSNIAEELVRQRLADEARKTKVTLDKLSAQILALSDDSTRLRGASPDNARDSAKSIAAVQRQVATEEQSRQQSIAAVQRALDSLRDELLTEVKERRGQHGTMLEEVNLLHRSVQQRDDRADSQQQHLVAELSELRERIAREVRTREAALAQVEQHIATVKVLRESSSGSASAPRPALAELALGGAGPSVSGERWRQLEDELERTRLSVVSLQGETYSLGKAIANCEERCDNVRGGLVSVQAGMTDTTHRHKASFEVEQSIVVSREELRKECSERKADGASLAARIAEGAERLEWTEQQRMKSEQGLRQEMMEVKSGMKKETRDREAIEQRVGALVREEAVRREEAIDRESRIRKEGEERLSETLSLAVREERRTRERELLRLEERGLVGSGAAVGTAKGNADGSMETRGLRQAIVDLQDRVGSAESRQKSAEERTVSMLDAIMSGLTGPQAN